MAVGSVVDSITPTICLERLARRWEFRVHAQLHPLSHSGLPNFMCGTQEILWENTQGA